MAEIVSRNAEVTAILRRQESLLSEHGGFIHPEIALVVATSGELRIDSKLEKTSTEVVIFVADECLPSLDDFEVRLENDQLVAKPAAAVSELHRELVQLQLRLYNLTDKIRSHRASFPILSLLSAPQLYHHLTGPVQVKTYDEGFMDLDPDTQAIQSFFKSRIAGARNLLLPVVDFVNHHSASPSFMTRAGAGVGVINSQPADSSECFTNYASGSDALKLYVQYGFLDTTPQFLRCVPMVINLPEVGTIEVAASALAKAHIVQHAAVADLEYYMPPVSQGGARALKVGHLLIPPPEGLVSLRRILEFLIRSIAPASMSAKNIGQNVAKAEGQVLAGTERFYKRIPQLLRTGSARNLPADTLSSLKKLSRHQLKQLERYKKQVKAIPLTYIEEGKVFS